MKKQTKIFSSEELRDLKTAAIMMAASLNGISNDDESPFPLGLAALLAGALGK